MTHDPLCPVPALLKQGKTVAAPTCQCDLIAKVREDERMSERTRWYSVNEEADFRVAQVRAAALRDAVAAVRALQIAAYESRNPWGRAILAIEALGGKR